MEELRLQPGTLHELLQHKDLDLLRRLGGVDGLAAALRTDLHAGIGPSTPPAARQAQYGRNELPPAPRQTLLDFVKEALEDKTMLILIGAAVLSLILGMTTPNPETGKVDYSTGWIEGFAILMSVAIVVLVTAVNDFKKQEKFAELETSSTELRTVIVLRDGHKTSVPHTDVVVGDVLLLEPGFHFSMDCVLARGDGLVCDERNLTGESDDVPKGAEDPFFISGTDLLEGVGWGLVVGVGPNSVQGHIAVATRAHKKPTPLEVKLEDLAEKIGYFGMGAAAVTFMVLVCKETHHIWFSGATFSFMKYWEMLTAAVAIVVVAVPEGLPLSVTIALAYSMQQMLEDKNLVRHLAACETMGGATCICSDKTGTLTSNSMRVTKLWAAGRSYDIAKPRTDRWLAIGTGHEAFHFDVDADEAVQLDMDPGLRTAVMDTICYSSIDENNRTAIAMILLLRRLGYETHANSPLMSPAVKRRPFSSVTKQSQTIVDGPKGSRLYVKGAAEIILDKCTHHAVDGGVEPLTQEARRRIENGLYAYANDGLRTLALAYRLPPAAGGEVRFDDAGMTFVALVGIEEPVRHEVSYAVMQCKAAGIDVKMVTGDNKVSAMAVARRCGIFTDGTGHVAMEGKEFRELPHGAAVDALRSLAVLARATPLDKQRLVELIKESDPNQVVAVTGDGTNDGPALKNADVGFAMNSGTDVAKSASDIVLTDDNFTGVVKAVMWGRNVNDNIRKFLQFQLTVNGAACATAVSGAFLSETNLSPLKPVQLLWLNLIMDSLAALGLATQLPSVSLLNRAPQPKAASIINTNMWFFIGGHGLYQFAVCYYLLTSGDDWVGVPSFSDEHLSFLFNTFVLMQITNFFNARTLSTDLNVFREIDRSRILMAVAVVIAVLQVLIINYGGKFFGTVPLSMELWKKSMLISTVSLPMGALIKLVQRRRGWKTHGMSPRLGATTMNDFERDMARFELL